MSGGHHALELLVAVMPAVGINVAIAADAIEIMIEIMTGMMTKTEIKLRQTFDDKTEEIQARDHSPAWISR